MISYTTWRDAIQLGPRTARGPNARTSADFMPTPRITELPGEVRSLIEKASGRIADVGAVHGGLFRIIEGID
ncbi:MULTISPECIES: hypothetical protein [unclassified Streptomyces]|uniref:hypothetical protein n=1 Tax=unclassified Streptomyces TaxID=2593676 RepID=UPI0033A376B6